MVYRYFGIPIYRYIGSKGLKRQAMDFKLFEHMPMHICRPCSGDVGLLDL